MEKPEQRSGSKPPAPPSSSTPAIPAWRLEAARSAIELYAGHPGVAFVDLAAEVATEVRLLPAIQAELAVHATEREEAHRWVDPGALGRRCRAWPRSAAPPWWRVWAIRPTSTGQAVPVFHRASSTCVGDGPERKGQAMSKAGSSLLCTTLVRAADHARKLDPQLARIYDVQIVERGKDHLGARCVVAANLAERAWAVMERGMPYVVCDVDGTPVTPEEAEAITPSDSRCRPSCGPAAGTRRRGRPPRTSTPDDRSPTHEARANGATFPGTHRRPRFR